MPMTVIPYARREPYNRDAYTTRMADLMLRRGDAAAEAARVSGDARARNWLNVGNTVQTTMADMGQLQDMRRREALAAQQKAEDNAFREREFVAQQAERESNDAFRHEQFRASEANSVADNIAPGQQLSAEDFKSIAGTPSAMRFSHQGVVPAQDAWSAPPVDDSMPDSGPAMPAQAERYVKTPNAQEAMSMAQLALSQGDRAFREREATDAQGQHIEDTRRAQANADRSFAEEKRQFNVRENRENSQFKQTQGAMGFGGPGAAGAPVVSGDEFLKGLPPAAQELVKSVADYKSDLTKVTSMRGNQRQQLAAMVMRYDPTFDMNQYASRAALRKDYTSGKAAANIRSLNTAIGHLDGLSKAAEALNNSPYHIWNNVKNWVEEKTGDPRVTNFRVKANAVESELATVFKGNAASDAEIKAWRTAISDAESPEQLQGVVQSALELMGSRMGTLTSQYESGMQKPKDFKILNDRSRKILENLGYDPDTMEKDNTVAPKAKSNFWDKPQ